MTGHQRADSLGMVQAGIEVTPNLTGSPGDVPELYDLQVDPLEMHNLSLDPAGVHVAGELHRACEAWGNSTGNGWRTRSCSE